MKLLLGNRAVLALLFIAFALLPAVANQYTLFVGNLMMLYIILAIGLNLLMGFAGQFAFANAAMFGIGAYGAGLLQVKLGWPFWFAAPSGALIAMAVGTLLAFPALRLSGVYLALATMAFAQATLWTMMHWETLTFGSGGFAVPEPDFSPLPVAPDYGVYFVSWIVTLAATIIAWHIVRSRIGRAFVAIRDGEIAAQALGIDLFKFKAMAFALSGLYAGVAGSLYCAVLDFVSPESFTLFEMIKQQAMVVVGGMGSIVGSVLGAFLLVFIIEALREVPDMQEIAFGALLLGFVLFRPDGLVSFFKRWVPGWQEPLHYMPPTRSIIGSGADSPVGSDIATAARTVKRP